LGLSGCGDDGGEGSSGQPQANQPAPPARNFPQTERRSGPRRTLAAVLSLATRTELVVSPAASVFYKGSNRYSFGVFERDRTQAPDAKVALYIAKAPPTQPRPEALKSEVSPLKSLAYGPFPAEIDTLQTEPAFRAKTTVDDPDAATVVYKANIEFPSSGEWRIGAIIRDGEQLTATIVGSARVGQFTRIPRVGEPAPRIHTPTAEDVGGQLAEITTRIPPDTMNEEDLYDVLGKKPVVLLFATPAFCQSRVCGPVVDVTEQVKRDYGDDAAFIHVEIFNDNDPNKGVRPQVRAFHLPSEPWLFVIDRNGVIRTEIEGAFGVNELTKAVKAVTSG
jgi:hypothetical protein